MESLTPEIAYAPARRAHLLLWVEFFSGFVAVPVLFAIADPNVTIMVSLLVLGILCSLALLRDPTFARRQLLQSPQFWQNLRWMLLRFAPLAVIILLWADVIVPTRMFIGPSRHPGRWALYIAIYCLVFVPPQEIVYRTFFFHRYAPLFRQNFTMVLASAAAFSLGHIVYWNFPAIALSFAGGLIFGTTYNRTRSLPLVILEHALYGSFVYAAGFGRYLS